MSKTTLAGLIALAGLAALAGAQQPAAPHEHAGKPVTRTEAVEVTATIDAIDHDHRLITLKGPQGNTETVYAGPEVKRFDELKVGDTVTFKYQESIAYKIRKAGAGTTASSSGASIETGKGPRPGGTITHQQTATVTIKAIDTKVPAVTVETADANTISLKVADPKALATLKVGDKVEVTYSQALMISVK